MTATCKVSVGPGITRIYKKMAIFALAGLLTLGTLAGCAQEEGTPEQIACRHDWQKCADNADLVKCPSTSARKKAASKKLL
jgi:hypothetical protein